MGTRFIPTYVGHTAFHLLHSRWFPVHPHLRGAYGSSGFSAIVVARFIPTYVGHTSALPPDLTAYWVHPHLRGAYSFGLFWFVLVFGSSPPTWGIRMFWVFLCPADRFIPTYVGHTCCLLDASPQATVHPHLRGAYLLSRRLRGGRIGSSPPTWGIQKQVTKSLQKERFIPTYVGHTKIENIACLVKNGSSPPTWGIHLPGLLHFARERFIPTYVGHTLRRWR